MEVKDFGPSWRDGVAFLALIDAIKANLINLAEMKKATNQKRLQTAFEVAESKLGIARLLDPEDVDVDKPDERSIMTYVAQFLHKYPEPKRQTAPATEVTTQTEYNQLVKWLEERTNRFDVLIQTNRLSEDFNDYLSEDYENRSKIPAYTKLLALARARQIVGIPFNGDEILESLWEKLQTQMQYWLWMLDGNLHGNLQVVGKWLSDAEKLLRSNDAPPEMNEEAASVISQKLEEHKQFFAEMPNIVELFNATKGSTGSTVNKQQINNMEQRLADIVPRAAQRRIHLKFLEHKCCLIAFLNLVETKLRPWTAKYGRQEKVQQLLDQYVNFVSKNKIFQEFGKAFVDMQQVVEEYKKDGNITKRDETEIAKFMRDTEARWKQLSMELKCTQNMLEEVVANWKRWNLLYGEFLPWLAEAEQQVVSENEQARLEFFQDVNVWREKFQLLTDTGHFLMSTCEDAVAVEIRQNLLSVTNRWERLFNKSQQYAMVGDLLKQKKEFQLGLEKLSVWLRNAEQLLNHPNLGSIEQIQAFGQEILKVQSEIETIEEVFKEVSRVFQGLIQDLPRDEVDKHMRTLKQEKEALVRVRAAIPSKLHLFHQLLVQYESLEAGQKELNDWLNNAERMLEEHNLNGGVDEIQDRLQKHKLFFSKTLYYRSMLESKNKIFTNLKKIANADNNLNFTDLDKNMQHLNERFEYVVNSAQQWDNTMGDALARWQNYKESDKKVNELLNQAQELLTETPIDIEQSLMKQKMFFENMNESWLHKLDNSVRDLLVYVPQEEQNEIQRNFEVTQNRWKELVAQIPTRVVSMDYQVWEKIFNTEINVWEHEVIDEQNKLLNKEDVDVILQNHLRQFKNPGNVGKIETALEKMQDLTDKHARSIPNGQHMVNATNQAKTRWEEINKRVDELGVSLNKIPEQWENYKRQFQNMVEWMNMVDDSLKSITTEVETMEQFEKEKIIFQVSEKLRRFKSILCLNLSLISVCIENCAAERTCGKLQDTFLNSLWPSFIASTKPCPPF